VVGHQPENAVISFESESIAIDRDEVLGVPGGANRPVIREKPDAVLKPQMPSCDYSRRNTIECGGSMGR